jgi:phosphoribosyl 1,2-cyclic phosphodiesterase
VFAFRSLASGSSGNAYLLKTGKATLLFEAGLRLPTLKKYLAAEDVTLDRLSAVLISHEHRDHCIAARELAEEYNVPIWANADVLRAAGLHGLPSSAVLEVNAPTLFGDVEVTCFPISHDAVRPVGFCIRLPERTIVVATDLGEVSDGVAKCIGEADLVVLEANHDTEMLQQGRYPYHLRRRVSGPTGHLSNAQAGAVLSRRLKDESVEVWLAHLSKENNTPATALRTVRRLLKAAGLTGVLPGVALRDRPSLRWTGVPRPRQLSLFSGIEPF